MHAELGKELVFMTHTHRFHEDSRIVEQGVISYFASRSLSSSRTVQDWFHATTAALAANHDLPPLSRPELELQAPGEMPLP
jgi:hypothetical protein